MEYLQYQLHVSASTLAIIRLAFNLSRDYTIYMVCSWEGGRGTRSRFTIVGSMEIELSVRISEWFIRHTPYCLLQGEHNVFPWLQIFITRKLRVIQKEHKLKCANVL